MTTRSTTWPSPISTTRRAPISASCPPAPRRISSSACCNRCWTIDRHPYSAPETPEMTSIRVAAVLLALALATTAQAHGDRQGAIEIGHPATRATPPGAHTGAGYLTVTNSGPEAVRLMGG